MVKINLLDTPEDDSTSRKQEPESSREETSKSEMDFSFLQPEETTPPPEPPTPPVEPEPITREAPQEDVLFATPGSEVEQGEDAFTYESGSKKKLFIILGIILVVLLAVLFVILWMGPGEEKPVTSTVPRESGVKPAPTQPVTTPTATSSTGNAPMLQRVYARNNGENQFYLNYASNLLGTSTSKARLSMVVIAPGAMYLSVLADSRDDIALFRRAVKDKLPGIQPQIENISPRLVGNEQKLMADFFLPLSGSIPPKPPGNTVEPLKEGAVLSTLRSQAQSNRLRIIQLKQGKKHREGLFNIIPCYMQVSGSKTAILGFLSSLTRKYPAIKFTKISIFPSQSAVIGPGALKARIEMNVTTPTGN